jgi:hypothetical protein
MMFLASILPNKREDSEAIKRNSLFNREALKTKENAGMKPSNRLDICLFFPGRLTV